MNGREVGLVHKANKTNKMSVFKNGRLYHYEFHLTRQLFGSMVRRIDALAVASG